MRAVLRGRSCLATHLKTAEQEQMATYAAHVRMPRAQPAEASDEFQQCLLPQNKPQSPTDFAEKLDLLACYNNGIHQQLNYV